MAPVFVFYPQNALHEPNCLNETIEALLQFGVNRNRIVHVGSAEILAQKLGLDKATLVIPGGSTFRISLALMKLIDRVKQAIAQGWGYVGFCAGGNFAAYEFTMGGSPTGIPLLQLLPTKAEYPAYSDCKSKEAPIISAKGQRFGCHWEEGSLFSPLEEIRSYEVPAKYADKDGAAAVVQGDYVRGKVVATGIHPELTPHCKPFLANLFSYAGIERG